MAGESDIHRALGELNGTLAGIKSMLERHENAITNHSNELAESRGASRANRMLVFAVPPAFAALVEAFKALWHSGGHS